ncbi:hypothetical protein BCR44DRAFT_1195522 [Catenaria anguillulae PL171]|uniref:Uncharacterized protein n=1 Tax=Catenaria anguillulae PL171 TaxID=765915 RepID=A0A1Y2HKS1_9FUNG|nr:hypothetical protein BCR44DRAFT_1195522 [Catenaria anguillulae PL171]
MKSKTKEPISSVGAVHRRRSSSRRRIADEVVRNNLARRVRSTNALTSSPVASSGRASDSDLPPSRLPPDPDNAQASSQSHLQAPPRPVSSIITSRSVQCGSIHKLGALSTDVLGLQHSSTKVPQRQSSRRSIRTAASTYSANHLATPEQPLSSQVSDQSTLDQSNNVSTSVYLDASQHLPVPTTASDKPGTIGSASTKSLQQSPTTYYDASQTAPSSPAGMLLRPVYAQLAFRFMAPQTLEPRQSELDVLDSSLLQGGPTPNATGRSGVTLASVGEHHVRSDGSDRKIRSIPESLDRFQNHSPPSSSVHGSTEAITGVEVPSPRRRSCRH